MRRPLPYPFVLLLSRFGRAVLAVVVAFMAAGAIHGVWFDGVLPLLGDDAFLWWVDNWELIAILCLAIGIVVAATADRKLVRLWLRPRRSVYGTPDGRS